MSILMPHAEVIFDIFSSQCGTSEEGDGHNNATLYRLQSCTSSYTCHSSSVMFYKNLTILQIFNLLFKSHSILLTCYKACFIFSICMPVRGVRTDPEEMPGMQRKEKHLRRM